MKKHTYALLATLCASAALAADLKIAPSDNPLDISLAENWNLASFSGADTLNINSSFGNIASDKTLTALIFSVYGNSGLTMNGTGASINSASTAGGNINWGTTANATTKIDILGSGNSVYLSTNHSFMFGSTDSTSGGTTLSISSSDTVNRNSFTVAGNNTFFRISTNAASTAVQKISIGNYSDFTVSAGNFRFGGENTSALAGGKLLLEMTGTGSKFYTERTIEMFNVGSGGMAGGTLQIDVGGTGNYFNAAAMSMGNKTGITGGTILADVNGTANRVSIGNITIGHADSTGVSTKFIVSGDNNIVTTAAITVNATGIFEVKGKGNGATTSFGSESNLKVAVRTGNITINNGGTAIIHAGSHLDMTDSSIITNIGSKLMLIANENGFLNSDGTETSLRVVNIFEKTSGSDQRGFAGILSLDFTDYIVKDAVNGDTVKILYATNTGIDVNSLNDGSQVEINGGTIKENSFAYDGNYLTVTIMGTIPEPAAYAAIFGALAIAFAAYRRKR